MTTERAAPAAMRYSPVEIERKWQQRWEADGLYVAREEPGRPKWYALVMFPYPSAAHTHVGPSFRSVV